MNHSRMIGWSNEGYVWSNHLPLSCGRVVGDHPFDWLGGSQVGGGHPWTVDGWVLK